MSIRPVFCFALSVIGIVTLAGGALAAPVKTVGELKLHSGPGAKYQVVGSLGGGVHVDVLWCGTDLKWCLINKNGKQGWVLPEELGMLDAEAPPKSVVQADAAEPLSSTGGSTARRSHNSQTAVIATQINPNH